MFLMKIRTFGAHVFLAAWAWAALFAGIGRTAEEVAEESAGETLSAAAENDQFTFILFWKKNDEATHALGKSLDALAPQYSERAVATSIEVGGSFDQDVVKRFNVSRLPMPIIVAVAPNGAVTGYFHKTFTADNVEKALVTPTMTICMKSMQGGKIVLVCAQATESPAIPKGARDFQADPSFKDRAVVVRLVTTDPAEARFLKELKIDARDTATQMAILAPPGVLVGKFAASATKDEMAAKLHAAGKCCDDENCKHNKKGQ
jgi:hypothetical protein